MPPMSETASDTASVTAPAGGGQRAGMGDEARPEISVLVPVLNEAGSVAELCGRVAAVLDGLGRRFEIVFVDDGSNDGTPDRVREVRARDPRVKLVRLRRRIRLGVSRRMRATAIEWLSQKMAGKWRP